MTTEYQLAIRQGGKGPQTRDPDHFTGDHGEGVEGTRRPSTVEAQRLCPLRQIGSMRFKACCRRHHHAGENKYELHDNYCY